MIKGAKMRVGLGKCGDIVPSIDQLNYGLVGSNLSEACPTLSVT